MGATKADVSKLDNPAWSKSNQQARTEVCAQDGNKCFNIRYSALLMAGSQVLWGLDPRASETRSRGNESQHLWDQQMLDIYVWNET